MDRTIVDGFLIELLATLKATKDFTVEQAPQVAQELLRYEFVCYTIWTVVGLVGLAFSFKFFKHTAKLVEEDTCVSFLYVFVAIAFILSGGILMCNLSEAIKIQVAPRVYLLEHLSSLVRSLK